MVKSKVWTSSCSIAVRVWSLAAVAKPKRSQGVWLCGGDRDAVAHAGIHTEHGQERFGKLWVRA